MSSLTAGKDAFRFKKQYGDQAAVCADMNKAAAEIKVEEWLALFSRDEAVNDAQHAIFVHWYARVLELSAMISARIRSDEAIENSDVGSSTEKKGKSGGGLSSEPAQLRPVEKQSYVQNLTNQYRILFSGLNLKPETFELLHPHVLQLAPMLALLIPVHKNEKPLEVLLEELEKAISGHGYDAFLQQHNIPVELHGEMKGEEMKEALRDLLAAFARNREAYDKFMSLTTTDRTDTFLKKMLRPLILSASRPLVAPTCRQEVAAQTAAEEIKSAPVPCA